MIERNARDAHNSLDNNSNNIETSGQHFTPGRKAQELPAERPKDGRKARGQQAEQLAADYLIGLGYEILVRNWRCRTGELDLIAWQDNVLVIVEVRSRSKRGGVFGTPAESVTPRKIKQVRDTAAVYMHHTSRNNAPVRFDMIGVVLRPDGSADSLDHIIAAF